MAVIELAAATVRRAHPDTHVRRIVMGPIDLRVEAGEHWVVLGPNGAGKTSLLLLAAAVEHPYSGTVTVLGGRLGHVDMRELREHIGFVQGRLVDEFEPWTSVLDVMLGGATGTILVREELLTAADRERARRAARALRLRGPRAAALRARSRRASGGACSSRARS